MRRRMLVVLLILGIAILAARDFANRSPARTDPPGREIRFLQFNSLDPLLGSPLAELQNSIDGISEAALRGHWFTASREQEELERIWLELKSQKKAGLEIEQEITRRIQDLGIAVTLEEKTKVLLAAEKLTGLVRQVAY